jgi:ATP-dependent Clp protease protease subunit
LENIEQDTDRDYFMDADEAITYGLVDKMVDRNSLEKKDK